MTQEEKSLLIQELSARFPYGVKVRINSKPRKVIGVYDKYVVVKGKTDGKTSWDNYGIEEYNIKPYLRTMSSMTVEEKEELKEEHKKDERIYAEVIERIANGDEHARGTAVPHFAVDWCNKNHFDYRGLIPKGLALEASKDMYNTKTE